MTNCYNPEQGFVHVNIKLQKKQNEYCDGLVTCKGYLPHTWFFRAIPYNLYFCETSEGCATISHIQNQVLPILI